MMKKSRYSKPKHVTRDMGAMISNSDVLCTNSVFIYSDALNDEYYDLGMALELSHQTIQSLAWDAYMRILKNT